MSPRPKSRNNAPPRATTATPPRLGVVAAFVLHAGVIVATLFSFQRTLDIPQESHAVPVDLVTITNQTNIRAMAPPAPPPPDKVVMPTPTIEQPPLPRFQEAEPAPDAPPLPKFDIKPDEKPVPLEPPPKAPPKKATAQDFDSLLNKLTTPAKVPKNAKPGPRVFEGVGNQNMMTADIADALRSQIRGCWSYQGYPPNPADAIVDFDVVFRQDGTVVSAQSDALHSSNPYTSAAAHAALRAIASCAPYKLPQQSYNLWHEVNPLHFDPREMMQ